MRASLTITGVEVDLSVPAGPLETLVAGRYAPFLGAAEAPACSLRIEPEAHLVKGGSFKRPPAPVVERESPTVFGVAHPSFVGRFDLEGAGELRSAVDARGVDQALRILFALLAPRHGGFLLAAYGVIGDDGAHVFAGAAADGRRPGADLAGDRPVLTDGFVMLRRLGGVWIAGSTPFWNSFDPPGPPRESRLARLWSLRRAPATETDPVESGVALHAVVDNAYLPLREEEARLAVFDLAVELTAAVPSSKLVLGPVGDMEEAVGASSLP